MRRRLGKPEPARVVSVRDEAPDIRTYRLSFSRWADVQPGQFVKLYVPRLWEIPISVSGVDEGYIDLTIAKVGRVTSALFKEAKVGSVLGLRGPLGRGWPVQLLWGRRVLLVIGGVGLAPVRMLIRELLGPGLTVLYGARNPSLLLYTDEYDAWREAGVALRLTVDTGDEGWQGHVGVVTTLLEPELVREHEFAVVAGPPIMMKFTVRGLLEMGMEPEQIYLTLENHMKCGVGLCGHCRVGDKYVCVDGPVFSYAEVKELEEKAAGEVL